MYDPRNKPVVPLKHVTAKAPYQHLQLDEAKFGETAAGNKYAICLIDIFSKYAWVVASPTKEARHVVSFIDELIRYEGAFPVLQSDNGGEFVNHEMKALIAARCIGIY